VRRWRLRHQGDSPSPAPAGHQGQLTCELQGADAAQAWPALSLLPGHLKGDQGGGGALLRLAQGRVPEAGPALREALVHLCRPALPGLLSHPSAVIMLPLTVVGAMVRLVLRAALSLAAPSTIALILDGSDDTWHR